MRFAVLVMVAALVVALAALEVVATRTLSDLQLSGSGTGMLWR